jgi:hypothetical protein
LWPNFKVLSRHLPGGTEENNQKPQDNRSPGQDLNPGTPENEAGVLTTRPRCLVMSWYEVLREKPIVAQVVKKFCSVYGTQRFIRSPFKMFTVFSIYALLFQADTFIDVLKLNIIYLYVLFTRCLRCVTC